MWGATGTVWPVACPTGISIHAPRVGSDLLSSPRRFYFGYFNPRSPCGERRVSVDERLPEEKISIHAPRVGSDGTGGAFDKYHNISIHAPRVGSDSTVSSTLTHSPDFNPRSPCGERRLYVLHPRSCRISIHAPRVGSDGRMYKISILQANFNPRSPCGERRWGSSRAAQASDFNPRSPCGERLQSAVGLQGFFGFQSTLPVWGATDAGNVGKQVLDISIHAPRVGSDFSPKSSAIPSPNFNPRSPCGERR